MLPAVQGPAGYRWKQRAPAAQVRMKPPGGKHFVWMDRTASVRGYDILRVGPGAGRVG
jgi:hypothetical protein